jgi:pSer/pThr/pTyr-binding forkhead associated (FHA) protein
VIAASIEVDEALLVLKVLFLVLLYLFIWRIVRAASRDVRGAQESMIITPGEQASLGLAPRITARLHVVKSPALDEARTLSVDSEPVTMGRGGQNDVPLDGDEYASAKHARFEARRDGFWVEDIGSTNGTYVNGARVTTPRKLGHGDLVRVGQTDLRVELT